MESISLLHLVIDSFRNIRQAEFHPGPRFNVISGNNGSGKTNLLEAIYFFSALRSFRTSVRQELIGRECRTAGLKGVFGGAAKGMCCDIEISGTFRKILKDSKEIGNVQDHFSQLPMVLFHPGDMILLQGGPKERRRFLDRALFQAVPSYPGWISDYNRALQSRNKLLKSRPQQLDSLKPFDFQLVKLGIKIIEARRFFIDSARPMFVEAAERIGKGLFASLTYKPDVEGDEAAFEEAFLRSFSRDCERGFTSRGPHCDDVEIKLNNLPARRFASQGQQRMLVLALKTAEVDALSNACKRTPVLLLDDISSELDREKNRELFSFLQQSGGQVFITTTHLDHVLLSEERMNFFINNGMLSENQAV
jgi:DNA replication and repair protein RecF